MLPDEGEHLEVSDNVKVVVRCRPLSQKEMMMGCKHSVTVDEIRRTITVNKCETPNEPPKTFTFDTVFGPDSKQPDVYTLTARPIVDSVLEGYNGTIFAYGQTGTGKTFTMEGVKAVPELRGIIPNSFAHIFNHIANAEGDTMFLVRVSYLEIYNEEVRDLLGKDQMQKLEMKESTDVGVYIKDLSAHIMKNAEDMDQIMTLGHKNRSVGATKMNEHSSRSHAIFTITIECSEKGMDGNLHVRMGKLHLVDLAGSERQSKTGATGQRLKEATKINLSLSNLGNVISALVDRKSTHVPYRNSKLTFLLQDSLGGNCKTMMCTNVGPADYNYDETICTLRYANRAKNIKNKAVINEDPKDALIRQLQKEIKDLKRRLKEGKESSESEGSDSEDMDEGEDEAADGGEGHSKQQGRSVSPDQMTELQEWKVQKGKLNTHNKVHTELDKREKDLLKARKEHQHQLEKLFALKKMVIGVDLLAKLEEQLKLLEKSNNELDERWQKKQQLCGELEEIEITDLQWESQRENVRQRRRNLGLLTQTSDKVIPQEYQKMIRENAQWNEELGRWQLKHAAYTGNDRKRQTLVPDKKEKDPFEVYYSYTEESLCQSLVRIERPKSMTGNRRRLSRLDTAIKHLLQ